MILFANGCSHTAGQCVQKPLTWPFMLSHSLINKEWDTHETHYGQIHKATNPQSLVDKTKNQLFEFSDHGKSNDMIYYETLHFLLSLEKENIKPDFVVIQWSGVNRRVHSVPGEKGIIDGLVFVNSHDNSKFGPWFEPYASKHTLQMMLHLQTYLKLNDIPYAFIPYMEVDTQNKYLIELDFLDESKCTISPKIGHRNEFRRKGLTCDTHGHPSLLGHYFITNKVLEILGCEELIKGLDFHLEKDKTGVTLKSSLTLFKERRKFIKYNQHTLPKDGVQENSDFWNSVLERYKSLI
tara:strand:- start:365 stop:1249 length:885 start_codon:yes stop_codon:yes gene_type:complete